MVIHAFTQELPRVQPSDTSLRPIRLRGLELLFSKPEFLFPSTPDIAAEEFPAYFRQSLSSPLPTLPWEQQVNTGLQSIWQREVDRQKEYKTLKKIVGSVQMGTVAYLTYLHLKKYGIRRK